MELLYARRFPFYNLPTNWLYPYISSPSAGEVEELALPPISEPEPFHTSTPSPWISVLSGQVLCSDWTEAPQGQVTAFSLASLPVGLGPAGHTVGLYETSTQCFQLNKAIVKMEHG